jgi:hypothetical protein
MLTNNPNALALIFTLRFAALRLARLFFLAISTTGGSSTDRFFGASLVHVCCCACCAASASCAARSRCSWAAACFFVWYRDNLRSAARRNVGIDALVRLPHVHDKIIVDRTLHGCAFENRGCVGRTQACPQLPGLSACPHWYLCVRIECRRPTKSRKRPPSRPSSATSLCLWNERDAASGARWSHPSPSQMDPRTCRR